MSYLKLVYSLYKHIWLRYLRFKLNSIQKYVKRNTWHWLWVCFIGWLLKLIYSTRCETISYSASRVYFISWPGYILFCYFNLNWFKLLYGRQKLSKSWPLKQANIFATLHNASSRKGLHACRLPRTMHQSGQNKRPRPVLSKWLAVHKSSIIDFLSIIIGTTGTYKRKIIQ